MTNSPAASFANNSENASMSRGSLLAPALVFGFGTAVSMWVAFFITHLPSLNIPAQVGFGLFVLLMSGGAFLAARAQAQTSGWLAGLLASLVGALVNVLLLGSFIVKQPPTNDPASTIPASGASGLNTDSLLALGGFILACAVLGVIAGAIGGKGAARAHNHGSTPRFWLSRFAIVTAVSFLPLLLIGGLVTTTGSGMSVRGWPDSFGANMFLYPLSLMTGHQAVFLEHSHRLFGTLVGLTCIVLTTWVLLAKVGSAIASRTVGLLILVCIQGALGGFRVTENSLLLSMLHGIAGQLTFAAAVMVMVLLLPAYHSAGKALPHADDRKRKALATALLHSTILQLIMGAAYRHLRHADSPGANHALWGHIAFSLIVVTTGLLAATFARSRSGAQPHDRMIRNLGVGVIACVSLQFVLGWIAFYFVHTGDSKGNIPLPEQLATAQALRPAEVIFRTIHQGNGAILLGLATMLILMTKQVWRAGRPAVVPPSDGAIAT